MFNKHCLLYSTTSACKHPTVLFLGESACPLSSPASECTNGVVLLVSNRCKAPRWGHHLYAPCFSLGRTVVASNMRNGAWHSVHKVYCTTIPGAERSGECECTPCSDGMTCSMPVDTDSALHTLYILLMHAERHPVHHSHWGAESAGAHHLVAHDHCTCDGLPRGRSRCSVLVPAQAW